MQISNFHCFVIVHCKELPEPVHCSAATSLQQTWKNCPNWTVAIFLLVCQELQRVDQVVAGSLWCRMSPKNFCVSVVRAVLYDQDPVRGPPIILAATSRTPPVTLPLPMPSGYLPNVVPKREAVTMKTHVRQSDTSYSITCCDCALQEISTFTQSNLRNVYAAFVFCFYLVVAVPHLCTCPYAEPAIFLKKSSR